MEKKGKKLGEYFESDLKIEPRIKGTQSVTISYFNTPDW